MTGVQIPRSQMIDTEMTGGPLTVGVAQLAFMVPVQYYDGQGKGHQEFVFVVGDTVYKDPSGEVWAAKLKVMTDKLSTEIVSRTQSAFQQAVKQALQDLGVTEAPRHDSLDVLADGVDHDLSSIK